jgi:segregation and condensation protein A
VSTDYLVHLDAFEGPLDLLLYLIRRAEVDITDIPISAIADQYMAYLSGIDRIDIDLAGEFLVMAATLMELKSRMLAPAKPGGDGDEPSAQAEGAGADPRAELVQQLLAYKKYRDAAAALEDRKHEWERRFPAGHAGVDDEKLREALAAQQDDLDLEDVSLVDLVEAFSKIVATVNFDRLGEHTVTYDDTPIELHAEDLLDRLKRETSEAAPTLPLTAIFSGRRRGEMIGLFLATLELVRRRAITIRQETPGGEIVLGIRPAEEATDPPVVETPGSSQPAQPAT